MKKTLKLFTNLFVMTVMFLGITVSASATSYPDSITVTNVTWLGGSSAYSEGRQYGMFTVTPNVSRTFCLDPDMKEPKSGSLTYFDMTKSFSDAQINKMVAVFRESSELGLSDVDSYYVTQFALWYAEYGEPVEGAGKGPFTYKTNNFFKNSSTYSNAYKKLISAIESANSGTDYTKTTNSISIGATNELTQAMEQKKVDGKKILLSTSEFKVSAPGNYTVSVSGGYLADSNGNKLSSSSLTTNDTFKIAIEIPENEKGNKSASFNVTTDNSYVSEYKLAGYQNLNSTGLQRLVLMYENQDKLSTSYTVVGNYDTEVRTTDIKIAKVNKENKLIAGAVLGIYDNATDGLINSYTSTTDYITVSLGEGSYYLKEISAPSGYLISDTEYKFDIDSEGNVKNYAGQVITAKTLTITDDLPKIKVKKVNEKGEPLSGAKIEICSYDMDTKKESNCNFNWITDGTVKELIVGVDFGEIKDGSYIIKELEAPTGYEISEPKYITVKDGKIYGDLQKDTVTIVDTTETTIEKDLDVSKTDATGQNEIPGAHMQIFDSKGKIIEEWDSEKTSHKVKGLTIGEVYSIKETLAPDGYVPLQTVIYFKLNEAGKVETLDCKDNNGELSCSTMSTEDILKIKNDVTKIEVSKIDITNEQELPGARLQILDENHKPVYQNGQILEWTSTDKPHYIEMLPIGTYYLVETFSPEGYVAVSNEVEFKVTATNEIQTVVFKNDVTKVLISKRDFTSGEEIEGANLEILDENHNIVKQNGVELKWVSGKEPKYIEKLPVGTYYLVETLPAEGYQEGMIVNGNITSEYKFEVTDNGLKTINVYNEVITNVPSTASNATTTYVVGSMVMLAGVGTITIAKKKNKEDI